MKTVFKKGQKVYDQVNFPNIEGKILRLYSKDCESFPIEVYFGETLICYTIDGRADLYSVPTLSTKPYKVELQGFEQKAPAPTYGEALVKAKTNFNGYPSYELAMAAEALQKLLFLRDYYNKDWRPDWSNTNVLKYVIIVSREKIEIDNTYNIKRILAFKSKEIRNKFLEEQKELLEIAKPLL